jgi:hypothetical protein
MKAGMNRFEKTENTSVGRFFDFRTVFGTENDKLPRTLANSHEFKIADFRESVFAFVRGKPLKPAFNQ